MKLLTQGIALAVVGAGLFAVPTQLALAAPTAAKADSGISAMKDQAQGTVAVSKESANGKIGFIAVRGKGDLLPTTSADSAASAAAKATAYLDEYAANFGARPGELEQASIARSAEGWTVSYTQEYQGVPVFASMIKANIDEQGDLTAVNGFAAPDLSLSTTPGLSADQAAERAVGTVRQDPPGHDGDADTTGIKAVKNELMVYRMGSTKGEAGKAVLAWVTEVSNEKNVRDMVFLDADNGKLLNRYSLVHDALDRQLYEASGTPQAPKYTLVWKEGDPFPGTLNEDQANEVDGTGDSYWFFQNTFGRDSYDGAGHRMITVNNDPRISCPNANWNGSTTNYCSGVSSDDVVAHEWGHAYTEYTHGLIYQYQSGALNESYSDIWGETVDLINGKQDAGEGDITTKRPDGQCSAYTRGDIAMTINSPATAAGPCTAVAAAFGPVFDKTGVTSDVVVATDAVETGGTANDGCSAYTNAAAVTGKFVYVDRGLCTFGAKAARADAAGATGIIVGDNAPDRAPISMSGNADIYGAMVTQADGARIKAAGTVNVTIVDSETAPKANSYRWLMGEKSTAFGGAIRDMWNPTCYGDPGKVSDAEYFCGTEDGGGVHSNSGVPNHGYALLVDGGTYNGQTVAGLGFDKSAAIYFRAMTAYQTPTTDFTDHADALLASCNDLVGAPISKVSTAANGTPQPATPVAAADCGEVTKMIAAVELRTDPTAQCGYTDLLDKNTPAVCGEGYRTTTVFSEDFEDGLAGWGTEQEVVFEGGFGEPWVATTSAPGNHPGGVAYGPAPDQGECSNGADDFSSRDSIISPAIELPASNKQPRLTFDHYVATESGYDGGNVKISVNGGDFTVIPADAYTFNAPGTLTGSATNTSPLAGEDGFTGTDGGKLQGSWGQSQVNLSEAGAAPGDIVKLRFDMGRDGCGGLDGWYVDNISIVSCKLKVRMDAAQVPSPSTYGKASTVNVNVQRDGSVGDAPSGTVSLVKADGTAVGTGNLTGGKASIALPADFPVGVTTLRASYPGTESLASESVPVTVTVKAAGASGSTTKAKIKPRRPSFRQDFRTIVRVKSDDGSAAKGKVVIKVDGKWMGKAKLKNGRVVHKVKKNLKVGKHKLVAIYKGSSTVEKSRAKMRFRVVR